MESLKVEKETAYFIDKFITATLFSTSHRYFNIALIAAVAISFNKKFFLRLHTLPM